MVVAEPAPLIVAPVRFVPAVDRYIEEHARFRETVPDVDPAYLIPRTSTLGGGQ